MADGDGGRPHVYRLQRLSAPELVAPHWGITVIRNMVDWLIGALCNMYGGYLASTVTRETIWLGPVCSLCWPASPWQGLMGWGAASGAGNASYQLKTAQCYSAV